MPVLEHELSNALRTIVAEGGMFYQLRDKTRELALEYPEYIVWSPELRGTRAVADIWDRAWNRMAEVEVPATQAMIDAPMW